ncbi:uncharacterized protein LY89DRAFT_739099 [Mollisia scopiformis]|uniref:Zn(2)-C6 fungal-type domain-containing protein n=1 Tax=Mollisia scopiformis TaxID=149040 RepID=A0A194WUN5_MOLSC|nr:uncharacterized protein LY89DRAFT_739099 [Mollisia scopiformis]KUJ11676.1 hypothetical protein LY89DRAFT_739099 [Mollisia scopiformis]
MAALHDHEQPQLRSSCHACAASKLRCSREKPTCSRCSKRGVPCEYVAAKRGGRKPNSRPSTSTTVTGSGSENRSPSASNTAVNSNANDSDNVNWFATPSANQRVDPLHSPDSLHMSPQTKSYVASPDILQDLFGPMDQMLSLGPPDTEIDLTDYISPPMSFSADMADVPFFGAVDFFSTGMDDSNNGSLSGSFPAFDVSELFAVSIPSPAPKDLNSADRGFHSFQEIHATESPCSCLVRALGLMAKLFPSSYLDQSSAPLAIQVAITQNEITIEAVSKMLECSCLQDGYLLVVVSLIIFRVLGWYEAIARQKTGTQDPPANYSRSSSGSSLSGLVVQCSTVGKHNLDGADSLRMTAQQVLGELHRVRRLIDQLSSKLKVQAAKEWRRGETEVSANLDLDLEMKLPLSAAMYSQLDVDLKKRLRALSLEMIDRLRRL